MTCHGPDDVLRGHRQLTLLSRASNVSYHAKNVLDQQKGEAIWPGRGVIMSPAARRPVTWQGNSCPASMLGEESVLPLF